MDTVGLDRVLAQLEPRERRAVELVYRDGRELGEAGRLLGVSAQAVSRLLAGAYHVVGLHVLDPDEPDTGATRFPPVTVRSGWHRA